MHNMAKSPEHLQFSNESPIVAALRIANDEKELGNVEHLPWSAKENHNTSEINLKSQLGSDPAISRK